MRKDENDLPLPVKPEDSVGYRKPPRSTRFRKGVSGNPKGRPKGSLNVTSVFMKALRERVVINEQGRRKTVTKLEAALKQLVNKAASGDPRALRQLLDLAGDAEAKANSANFDGPMLNEADQEVMQGILERLQMNGPNDYPLEEVRANHDDSH